MFDVGLSELVLIAVLALVIAGPERLPGIMRTLGRFTGRARAMFAAVRVELEREAERAEADENGHKHGRKSESQDRKDA